MSRIYQKIKYIIKWLPILWNDECWDWTFILQILQFKIKCQREYIGKWDRHTTAQQDCKHMRTAELLLERLRNDDYARHEWEEHYKSHPRIFDLEKFFSEPSNVWPAPSEAAAKDAERIFNKEKYMWEQDWDYLSKHLKKHLKRWWD